ncbi:hypothetical protein VTN02DRAFT_6390 [Thermoascus thermophilus]
MPPPQSPIASNNKKYSPNSLMSASNSRSNSVIVMSRSSTHESDSGTSGIFSEATKLETKKLCGNDCWACGSSPVQICHVFGKQDPQVPLWIKWDLISFSLTSVDNAIPLCPTCHANFDQSDDPGFIFMPMVSQFCWSKKGAMTHLLSPYSGTPPQVFNFPSWKPELMPELNASGL